MKPLESSSLLLLIGNPPSFAPPRERPDENPLLRALRLLSSDPRRLRLSLEDSGGCPETCAFPEICSYESPASSERPTLDSEGAAALREACDAGALGGCSPPSLEGACGFCGEGGGEALAALLGEGEIAAVCGACEFLACCDGGSGFEGCADLLGGLEGLVDESGGGGESASPVGLGGGASPSPGPVAFFAETLSAAPTPSPLSDEVIGESIGEEVVSEEAGVLNETGTGMDDFFGGTFGEGFNQSVNGTDDFLGGLFGGGYNESGFGSDDFLGGLFGGGYNQSGFGCDDFLGGLFGGGLNESVAFGGDHNESGFVGDDFLSGSFGGGFNESSEGSDDWLGGILGGDYNESAFGGMFDYNENDYDYDDFFGSIFGSDFDELGNGTDDFLGGLLGGGFDSESGGAGLSDLLSGVVESFGGLLGDLFGMIGENETQWMDKGNISGWDHEGMFGSFVCSEDTTCPVEGFCDCLNGDLASCSLTLLDDVCSSGSAFACAPDSFQEMCDAECPAPPRRLEDMEVTSEVNIFTSPECAMCHIARCCDAEETNIDECAREVGIDPQTILGSTEEGTFTNMSDLLSDEFVTTMIDNLTSVLDEFIGNISMPVFCPSGTCAVDGFCECFTGDFTQCNAQVLSDACTANSFFECGPEDWENFCSTECDGVVETLEDVINVALCSVCAISRCCKDGGSPDDCVFGDVPLMANHTTTFSTESGLASVSSTSGDPATTSQISTESATATESDIEADAAEDLGESAEESVLDKETQPVDESAESTASDAEVETDSEEVMFSSATEQDGISSGASKMTMTVCFAMTLSYLYFVV